MRLPAAETQLGLVHKVGAENGDAGLELPEDGLADAERLDGFFVGAAEDWFVLRAR